MYKHADAYTHIYSTYMHAHTCTHRQVCSHTLYFQRCTFFFKYPKTSFLPPLPSPSPVTHTLTRKVTDVCVSNGMAWSPDNTKMYYIDSGPRKLWSFDFNDASGCLTNRQVLVDFHDKGVGIPDGMCTDSEGRLWVAGFFGAAVSCWDPATGELLAKIEFPARRTTSCCFGGPDFGWMFVTTARVGAGEEELSEYPLSGAVFVVREVPFGAKGVPPSPFKWAVKSMV